MRLLANSASVFCSPAAVSLVVLVLQNSLLVVLTRLSRSNIAPSENYYASTVVLNQEIVKMGMCLLIFAYDESPRMKSSDIVTAGAKTSLAAKKDVTVVAVPMNTPDPDDDKGLEKSVNGGGDDDDDDDAAASPLQYEHGLMELAAPPLPLRRYLTPTQCLRRLRANIWKKDTTLLLLPQVLFTFQNFLIFIGLGNLDAVSFQVWSQTKLLSAALFSVWLLGRRLAFAQWISLALLTAGVLVTQLNATTAVTASTPAPTSRRRRRTTEPPLAAGMVESGNMLLGITACVLSGLSSSYAGVYFEKVVKTTAPTLAIRNIQLSLFGIPLALFSMVVLDVLPSWRNQARCGQSVHWNIFLPPDERWQQTAATSSAGGASSLADCPAQPFFFWRRYDTWLTWGIVTIHAFGGLLVAIVVRYADNILKGFATGIAVIVSGMMSAALWGYQPTWEFAGGAFMVMLSSIMFHRFEKKR